MKIEFWVLGKTKETYLKEGTAIFQKRITKYNPFQIVEFPDKKKDKNLQPDLLKAKESQAIFNKLDNRDLLILLDERGKSYTSVQFAGFLQEKLMDSSYSRIIFLVGGAYGFDETLYQRAQHKLSLSKMTFSHQMVRLFFLEQLYRAFSILHNEPYHNE